jgi:hypothetical protein
MLSVCDTTIPIASVSKVTQTCIYNIIGTTKSSQRGLINLKQVQESLSSCGVGPRCTKADAVAGSALGFEF